MFKNKFLIKSIELVLLLILILLLTSLFNVNEEITKDYNILTDNNLTFYNYITLDFPKISNPIGPIGAFFSYILCYFFGKFVSISCIFIIITFILLKLININKLLQIKLLLLIPIIFSLEAIRCSFKNSYDIYFFYITGKFIYRIIGNIGYIITHIFIILVSLTLIFGKDLLINQFITMLKYLKNLLIRIFTKKENIITIEDKSYYSNKKEKEEKITETSILFHQNKPKKISKKPENKTENNIQRKENYTEYILPDIDEILDDPIKSIKIDENQIKISIKKISKILIGKLAEFNIDVEVVNVNIGPIITQYELDPAPGIKVSKFTNLSDDIALAIKAKSIRVQAPIPGRGLIGIEIPNKDRDIIYLKDILLSHNIKNNDYNLLIGLGKDISGKPIVTDLAKTPHLLIAGATGSGKSVCINTLINSLLLQYSPDYLRLIMIDPKRIELGGYEGIPHLIQEVVTEPEKAITALLWAVNEMERRYQLLQKYSVRDIKGYNLKIEKLKNSDENIDDIPLPFIVMIVDEFADLIMTAGKEIEQPIARLAQKARAIGIHLILATQRPSTKVITGVIKANFPSRIAFQVSSKIDSRVILDTNGAEKLLGKGDMLFLPPGKGYPERIHGAYMSDNEIDSLVDYLKLQPKPEYEITMEEEINENNNGFIDYDDELFPDSARAVVSAQSASVSMLQRHFKIGYARAGRLIDLLEKNKIIGPHVGSKSRDVLFTEEDLKNHDLY